MRGGKEKRREDKRQEIVWKSRSFKKKKVRREKENRWGWR